MTFHRTGAEAAEKSQSWLGAVQRIAVGRMALSLLLLGSLLCLRASGRNKTVQASPAIAAASSSDPVLQAMLEELARSKAQLRMENVPPPFYIEYRLSDLDEYNAEAAFGALRQDQRFHGRVVRAVVRVGDYQQDSYYGGGMGIADFSPLDDDPLALRHQLWLATDRAYKAASEALTAKRALLKEFTSDQTIPDFAPAPAVQSLGPVVRLNVDTERYKKMLVAATALYRTDPQIESLTALARFRAANQYFVNSEGTITRQGKATYLMNLVGSTQAADGMRLERSPYFAVATAEELPSPEQFQKDAARMLETLKRLREAPVVEEAYTGPVLFEADAAVDVFAGLVGLNVLGHKPKPGASARTTGAYASSYNSRVLPDFLSLVDDPTQKSFQGHALSGSYEVDDEGVKASLVKVVENGRLTNYLLGREPIRDFASSNGHARAGPGAPPAPNIGNLFVQPKQPMRLEEMKKKLIEMCREQGRPYGYMVETLGPGYSPRLLYRVSVKDGHEELVRGGTFTELDTRTLRNNLVAAGDDFEVSNREGIVPSTVISPSILFDELVVNHITTQNPKLPEYPPPAIGADRGQGTGNRE